MHRILFLGTSYVQAYSAASFGGHAGSPSLCCLVLLYVASPMISMWALVTSLISVWCDNAVVYQLVYLAWAMFSLLLVC